LLKENKLLFLLSKTAFLLIEIVTILFKLYLISESRLLLYNTEVLYY